MKIYSKILNVVTESVDLKGCFDFLKGIKGFFKERCPVHEMGRQSHCIKYFWCNYETSPDRSLKNLNTRVCCTVATCRARKLCEKEGLFLWLTKKLE